MKVDPITLKYLLESMDEGVREMHALMRAPIDEQTLNALARTAHKLRGEATVVGLANLSLLICALEDSLDKLRSLQKLERGDLHVIGMHLLKIVKVCEHLRKNARESQKASSLKTPGRQPAARTQTSTRAAGVIATLQVLATNVARSCGKRVLLNLEKFTISDVPPEIQIKVQDIIIQLVRNAIAHGIELPGDRQELNKAPIGMVAIVAKKNGNELLVAVRDNGQGIELEDIRRKLVVKYQYSVTDAAKMSRQALLKSLFMPGFSTMNEQQQHAGRGVGLDLVKEHTYSLGGSVDVSFKEQEYTQFVIRIPLERTEETPLGSIRTARRRKDKKPRILVPTLTDIANL